MKNINLGVAYVILIPITVVWYQKRNFIVPKNGNIDTSIKNNLLGLGLLVKLPI